MEYKQWWCSTALKVCSFVDHLYYIFVANKPYVFFYFFMWWKIHIVCHFYSIHQITATKQRMQMYYKNIIYRFGIIKSFKALLLFIISMVSCVPFVELANITIQVNDSNIFCSRDNGIKWEKSMNSSHTFYSMSALCEKLHPLTITTNQCTS